MVPARDAELVQILDQALADAARRGGSFLACRPGCTPCCHGVFRISALDAERLRAALMGLQASAPARAEAIRERARWFAGMLAPHFPGDASTGWLDPDTTPAGAAAWEAFADLPAVDAPCPVLDPATGRCELYGERPVTCRVFGPPVQNESGLGVCELCYQGATETEILAGELYLMHEDLEAELDRELAAGGVAGETIIAWAIATLDRDPAPR